MRHSTIIFLMIGLMACKEQRQSASDQVALPDLNYALFNNLPDLKYSQRLSRTDTFTHKGLLNQLIRNADSALAKGVLSVVQKKRFPPSGDKHDYMSVGPYWWPNPDTKDGLPYIRKDGQVNPERYDYPDAEGFKQLSYLSRDLLYAYFFTGKQAYAEKAAAMIDTWFINDSTRMNPHLKYAQAIPGINEGRPIGIIDVNMIVSLIEVLPILNASSAWSRTQEAELRKWLSSFLSWLLESEFGKIEAVHPNNHGTWYDVTVISIAKYLGKNELAYRLLQESKQRRFDLHLATDGSQSHEIERTRSLNYSAFNLKGLMYLALMAEEFDINLWNYENKHGATIEDALKYLEWYMNDPEEWPHPQIVPFNDAKLTELFKIGAKKYKIPYLQKAGDLLYSRVADDNTYAGLLYVDDAELLDIATILEYTGSKLMKLHELSKEKPEIPRSYMPDEKTIRWRPVKDWTSGFFAGSLWMQYALTGEAKWKTAAELETLKVKEQQFYTGSHDVGFQIMCSFGSGLALADMPGADSVIIRAAQSLATRFSPKVGAIKSWDWGDTDSYRVIIDNMINLELLFKATELSGDSSFYKIASSHADKTLKNHFREDNSTYHVVEYDTLTGIPLVKRTHQGFSDSTTWSRGQGWALYGYTMCYRYTLDKKYLKRAKEVASFILDHPTLSADGIPFWDFDHPDIPYTYKDVSAAGIYASALQRLSDLTTDDAKAARYRASAERMILSMIRNYKAVEAVPFLLDHSVGDLPQASEVDVPINYADYYFMESLYLYQLTK